jgi:hypothetical protein
VDETIPHLWSVFSHFLRNGSPEIESVSCGSRDTVLVQAAWNGAKVEAQFGRHSAGRRRWLELDFADGGHLGLDFTDEPGLADLDGVKIEISSWSRALRPVAAVQRAFLEAIEAGDRRVAGPIDAERSVQSVRLAETIRHRVVSQDAKRLARIAADLSEQDTARMLILENLGSEIDRASVVHTDMAPQSREALCEAILHGLRTGAPPRLPSPELKGALDTPTRASAFLRKVNAEIARKA